MSSEMAAVLTAVIFPALVLAVGAIVQPHSPRPAPPVAQVAPMITGTDPRGITWVAVITGPGTARLIRDGETWVDALGRDTLTRLTARYAITWVAQ